MEMDQVVTIIEETPDATVRALIKDAGVDPGFSEGGVRIRSGYRGWR